MSWATGKIKLFGASCCATAIIVCLYIFQSPLLQQVDLQIYDSLLRGSSYAPPSQHIAIIDIDEKSLEELGQWPWPRYRLAQLLDTLDKAGVASIGLDVLLAENDRTSPERIVEALENDFGLRVGFQGLPVGLQDNDAYLAEVLRRVPVVLGTKLEYREDAPAAEESPAHSLGIVETVQKGAPSPKETIFKARGLISPLPLFMRTAPLAIIDVAPDMDGVVRRIPVAARLDDVLYFSLSLRTLMQALGSTQIMLVGGEYGLEGIRLEGLDAFIPTSPEGMLHIPFKGRAESYPYISAVDVIEKKVPQEALEGKIVFVGSSAAGLLDMRATPYSAVYPGVEVHATTVDAILHKEFIVTPSWTPAAQVGGIIVAGVLCLLLFTVTRVSIYLGTGLFMGAGTVFFSQWLWAQGLYFSPTYISLNIVLQALLLAVLRMWQSEHQKKYIQTIFGQYVAPEVVDTLVASGKNHFKGEECDVTIMFTDIRGFTAIADGLSPEEVVELLNAYFTPITALIRDARGTLDKFIGDALMAFWGAPMPVENHEQMAVATALQIGHALTDINKKLLERFDITLTMGIGLHSGSVYAGNMGSEELIEYTIIGDNVNIASRLEGLSGIYGLPLIASDALRQKCPDVGVFVHIDDVVLRGKTQAMPIYTILDVEEAERSRAELLRFEEARNAFLAQEGAKAKELFTALYTDFPTRATLYELFIQRLTSKEAKV